MSGYQRRIASVIAVDVVEFSRQMESDEQSTLDALMVRRSIFSRLVQKYGGREFGSVGDSMMAELPSALDAVRCSIELQQEFQDVNNPALPQNRMQLRIGINLGDVQEKRGALYGNTVNIAARLQEIAPAGGILISAAIREQVKKNANINLVYSGNRSVKNISEPIATYIVSDGSAGFFGWRARFTALNLRKIFVPAAYLVAILIAFSVYHFAFRVRDAGTLGKPNSAINTVAILPFDIHDSDDEEIALFARGLREELHSQLGKIADIRVTSRNSSAQFSGPEKDIRAVARELNVSSILDGTIQRFEQQIRVRIELIDGKSQLNLWSDSFPQELDAQRFFLKQAEIANNIARALKANLTAEDRERLAVLPTNNFDALKSYWIARDNIDKRTVEGLDEAVMHLQDALALDPNFVEAKTALADTYLLQGSYTGTPRANLYRTAKGLIDEVFASVGGVSGKSESADAYSSRGFFHHESGNYSAATADFQRALALNQSSVDAHRRYGILLLELGQGKAALEQFESAYRLDPLSSIAGLNLSDALAMTGQFKNALNVAENTISIAPRSWHGYWTKGFLHWTVYGKFAKAFRPINESFGLTREPLSENAALLAMFYLDLGDVVRADCWARQAWAKNPESFYTNYAMQNLSLFRGDASAAEIYAAESLKYYPLWWRASINDDADDRIRGLLEEEKPIVDRSNFGIAIDLAHRLKISGDSARANKLIDGVESVIDAIPRLGFYGYWVDDARLYALKNQPKDAIKALDEALDSGWRFRWWYFFDHDPVLASLRNIPEYQRMREDITTQINGELKEIRSSEQRHLFCTPIDFEAIIVEP